MKEKQRQAAISFMIAKASDHTKKAQDYAKASKILIEKVKPE